MNGVAMLLAIERIKTLRARYLRCVDGRDWHGLAALFARDGVLELPDDMPDGGAIARVDLAGFLEQALHGVTSVHHGHMPEIEFHSDTAASGIWAMEDRLFFGPGSSRPGQRVHGYGHYHDDYILEEGNWRFQKVVLRRLRVDRLLG